jgi:hypothetical protein
MVLNLTSISLITYLKWHEFISLNCNESNFDSGKENCLKGRSGAISRDSEIIFDCQNFLMLEC